MLTWRLAFRVPDNTELQGHPASGTSQEMNAVRALQWGTTGSAGQDFEDGLSFRGGYSRALAYGGLAEHAAKADAGLSRWLRNRGTETRTGRYRTVACPAAAA